jgi:chloramphenicol O-acetyltransferase type A
MRKIDLNTWERKSHYTWFSSFADPSISVDVKMNVSNVLNYCKENQMSSYAIIMYVICKCLNQNKAFRLRVLNDEIIEIDKANVAYTIMVNDSCFVNCRANLKADFATYMQSVKDNQIKYTNSNYIQEEYNTIAIVDDIYCSCVPWLNFQSIKQPMPDKIPESKSIPRACWGKYYSEGDSMYMTLNLTANHALVDGIDLSNAIISIQNAFDTIDKFINI